MNMFQETVNGSDNIATNSAVSDMASMGYEDGLSNSMDFGMPAAAATGAPHSPALSDRSLIFERNVQDDPFLLAASSNTTLTSFNNNDLYKQRSNSSASLYRQKTYESVSSTNSYVMNNISNSNTNPQQGPIIPKRGRGSRANSSSNGMGILASPLSTSMNSPTGFISPNSNNNNNNYNTTNSNTNNGLHHNRRRTLENCVAPALDASCSLMAEEDTDLAHVNIIHSRSSSTIGLDMALGRISSHSRSNTRHNSTLDLNHDEMTGSNGLVANDNDSKVLKFYSYNDLLNDEKIKDINVASYAEKRPSLTPSHSTSLLKSPTSPLQIGATSPLTNNSNPNFLNPFALGRSSSPFLSPQQHSRRFSTNNNSASNQLSKSPTNSSQLGFQDILTNNINNTSSVLLQDPLSTGNITSTNIKNHLRKSISKSVSQQQVPKRSSQENNLVNSVSKFHITSSESESENDEENFVANNEDDIHGGDDIISSMPMRIKTLRSFSGSSQNRNSPLMVKTTNFLNSRSRTNSIIQLQQHFENVVNESIISRESPVPLEEYQLQTEKIGDVIKGRASSTK